MPDISMCATAGCPLAARCYRHPASGTKPSERQLWVQPKGGRSCPMFCPVRETEKVDAAP